MTTLKVCRLVSKPESNVSLPMLNLELSSVEEVSIPITVKEWNDAEKNGTLDSLLVNRKYHISLEAKNRKTCSWAR